MAKMKKFRCNIVETITREVEVYGKDMEDAHKRLIEMYDDGDIVLDKNDDIFDAEFEDWEEIPSTDDYHGEYE